MNYYSGYPIGQIVIFNYSGCTDERLEFHDGSYVRVLRRLTPEENELDDVQPLFEVCFTDLTSAVVFGDELWVDADTRLAV